jgi:DNA-binding beta-propeller fold protein YncE
MRCSAERIFEIVEEIPMLSSLPKHLGQSAGMAFIVVGCFVYSGVQSATADASFSVVQRWKLGGAGGWDYLTLDAAGDRLFVSRGTHVDVVNTQSGKIVGTIPNTNGVHGIALAEDLHRGYTSNGRADSVTMFDLGTLKTIKEAQIPAHNPDAILYEPFGRHVWTFNGRSKDVTVLDADSLAVVRTLAVPDKPEFAVDDGEGRIFVNIESEAGQLVVLDSRQLTIRATWMLPGCASPSGLAIDKAHHRLFSVCDKKVMAVTDSVSGRQIAKLTIGDAPDAAAYDVRRGLVFSSNGEGTLTIFHQETPDRYQIAQSVTTQRGARTMALDSSSGKVYLVSADFDAPPAPRPEQPHPRPIPTPETFTVLAVGPQ